MTNAIEVHDLVKVFGQDTVLKGINRNFEAGVTRGCDKGTVLLSHELRQGRMNCPMGT